MHPWRSTLSLFNFEGQGVDAPAPFICSLPRCWQLLGWLDLNQVSQMGGRKPVEPSLLHSRVHVDRKVALGAGTGN